MSAFDKIPKTAKLLWAAGVFESRVTIMTGEIGIKIESKDRLFLERFRDCVGIGAIYDKAPHPGRPKVTYMYKCYTAYEVATLLKLVLPYLTHKCQLKVLERIKVIEDTNPYKKEVARLAALKKKD